jgi:hypothetical protein
MNQFAMSATDLNGPSPGKADERTLTAIPFLYDGNVHTKAILMAHSIHGISATVLHKQFSTREKG